MKKYKEGKQFRYKGYDYSQDGFYFVTICTKDRNLFFGDINNGKMELSDIGVMVDKYWMEIPVHFPIVVLDEYVVMPNHVHGIIRIDNDFRGNVSYCENAPRRVPTVFGPLIKNSLSSIINHYKGKVKKYCNKNDFAYFCWQSRFHDRIIRNDDELNKIRNYIISNPEKWELDRSNQENLFM